MRLSWRLLVLCSLVAMCSVLSGPTAQLQQYEKAEAAKDFATIENSPIDAACVSGAGSDACPKLFAIRARACMQLARDEAAPGAACPPPTDSAKRRLDCAASNFAAARQASGFTPVQRDEFTEMRARALYCGATFRDASEGVPMDQTAGSELASLPPNARRDQLAASAALNIANRDALASNVRCDAARQAVHLAERGLTETPTEDLAAGLRGARSAAQGVLTRLRCGSA
jgi:hypothetical protein